VSWEVSWAKSSQVELRIGISMGVSPCVSVEQKQEEKVGAEGEDDDADDSDSDDDIRIPKAYITKKGKGWLTRIHVGHGGQQQQPLRYLGTFDTRGWAVQVDSIKTRVEIAYG